MDIEELNSASYRGIDSIREIQRNMNLCPASGAAKVYILDEVHKLSNDAQNAALKMLEDTPNHVYFFLATTDPDKVIKAVRTRCTEMPVNSLSGADMVNVLARVEKKEKLTISNEVRDAIVAGAQGSARTALVLLDKVRHLPPAQQAAAVEEQAAAENQAIDLCRALIKPEKWNVVADILKNMNAEPENVRRAVLGYARAVLLNKGSFRAYVVLDCFSRDFFTTGGAGLALACYEAINQKE
jgi:DNA polymerase III gamma/tau subunit